MTPILRLCARCPNPATPGQRYCPKHQAQDQQRRRTKDKQAGYSSLHWQHIRAEALTLHPYCAHCGSTHDLTVHLHPSLQGDHSIATLAATTVLCRPCHGSHDAPRAKHKQQ